MFETRKELKRMETANKANEQLVQLGNALKSIDKMIEELYADAKAQLLLNDEAGFELMANSIFYFQDIRKIIQTIKTQFQAYTKTAEFMNTIEGIRPILRQIANNMNAYPSISKNNKDFAKFKKSLLRGQLNMKAMGSMMTSLNPAVQNVRSKDELDALKERLLVGTNSNINVDTGKISDNQDFFDKINKG